MTSIGGVHSGRYSAINGIPSVQGWSLNDDGTLAEFVNSATAAGHGRKEGTSGWTGSYNANGGVPSCIPGTLFGFVGFTAPDTDILSGTGMAYSGNAMANSASINWDWASGAVLSHQVSFDGDLALTSTSGHATVTDATISDPEPVGPCSISYTPVTGGSAVVLANCLQASLQISNAVQGYVNSSTTGLTGRRAGIFDFGASITIEDTIAGSGLTRGGIYLFKFYTTASVFWQLKWMRVKGFTGIQCNPQTGAIIQHTVVLEQAGTANVSGTPTLGNVITPAGTTIWGV